MSLAAGERRMDVVKQADVSGAIASATKQPLDIREHVEREDYQTIGAPFVTDPKMTARNVAGRGPE
jgi:hypothetical protein